ncbi:MAG: ADP-ribosylglycohydrolase family protein [Nitrococcus sp.]|nr:ADP-ribosylglycohydrolase family protein [Nitrococcus sp.]
MRIDPAWKVSLACGMPCSVYHHFPAVYYLSARFAEDFEAAVLNAVNDGGQNQGWAMLTCALVGAMVRIGGIPNRLVDGLDRAQKRLVLVAGTAADVYVSEAGGFPHLASRIKRP